MNNRCRLFFARGVRRIVAYGILGVLVSSVSAAEKPSLPAAEPKTHAVFIGLDLSAEFEGKPRRIVSITQTTAEIALNGSVRRVRPETLKGFIFDRSPKVSTDFVELEEIAVEPGLRAGGLVDQAWAEAKRAQWLGETIRDVAEGRTSILDQPPKVRDALRSFDDGYSVKGEMMDTAEKYIEAGDVQPDELTDDAKRKNLFDALNVSFRVSAPQTETGCYAVLVCTIRPPGSKPKTDQVVFFCDIGTIDQAPRRMKAQFGGLPVGFRFVKAEFHVYSGPRELASNVAPNSFMVTERQANQFLVLQYVAAHKGETLPARLASAPGSSEGLKKISEREKAATLRLSIDPMGTVAPGFVGSASTIVHDYVAALRFYPALENGKAVASTLNITLAELAQ